MYWTSGRSGLGRIRPAILALAAIAAFTALPDPAHAAGAALCSNPLSQLSALTGFDRPALERFYAQEQGCVWTDESASELIAVLARAGDQALGDEPLHLDELSRLSMPRDEAAAAQRDLLLTDAAIRYARAMTNGRVEIESLEDDVDFPRATVDPVPGLELALAQNRLSAWLATLPPAAPEYRRLVGAYTHYRDIAAKGGWPQLPALKTSLKPGHSSPVLPLLARRLVAEGDLMQSDNAVESLDGKVLEALKRFQARHGMEADGVLGKKTIAALNMPAAARVDQIAANLERWHGLGRAIPATRIEVNAAAATATLIIAGKPALRMRAIVGARKTPTPVVLSNINAVIVNPPWVVPRSIIRKEIMPALARNPNYLEKNDMHWRDDQLVQAPGEKNSLGYLKFEFPSSFDVYMHDTPYRNLFARDERARSHGCVRLEKPLDLAERLLQSDPDWSRANIEEAIAAGATLRIPVPIEMAVVITYWTSFVDEDGTVEFRDDLYGRDARLLAALAHRPHAAPGPVASLMPRHCDA
jgi:murein L,D-transpeptidase YcbB/YkuD